MNKKILNLLVIVTVLAIFIPFNVNAKTRICTSYYLKPTNKIKSQFTRGNYIQCKIWTGKSYDYCYVKNGIKYDIYLVLPIPKVVETESTSIDDDGEYSCVYKDSTTKATTKTTTKTTTTAKSGGLDNALAKKAKTSGCYYCNNYSFSIPAGGQFGNDLGGGLSTKYKYFQADSILESGCSDTPNSSYVSYYGVSNIACIPGSSFINFQNGGYSISKACLNPDGVCNLPDPFSLGISNYANDSWCTSNNGAGQIGGGGTSVNYSNYSTLYTCKGKSNPENTTKATTVNVKNEKTFPVTTTKNAPTSYVTTPEKPKLETINAYRYANDDALYQGNNISCSDKLYISTCDDSYCEVTSINGTNTNTTTLVYKNKISTTDTINSCSNKTRYVKENSYSYSDKELSKDAKEISCGSEIKLIKSLGDACQDSVCEVSINNENVFIKEDIIVTTKPTCSNTQATSNNLTGFKGTTVVQITYEKDKDELIEQSNLEEAVTCADGFNKSYYMVSDSDTCKDIESGTCSKNYQVSCIPKLKPKVSGTGSTVRSNGYGTISFSAVDVNNVGIKGYYISSADTPTINSEWTAFRDNTYSASAELLAGTYFIWVIDNNNTISYSLMVRVIDTDSSNSLSSLSVKSVNGTDYTMKSMDSGSGEVALVDKTLNYVRLSNELKSDSVLAGFESLATGYEVTVKENKIAVYATLTSADASYVEGYEPRTVDLEYGRNVILIKIMNKQGKVRTYTIIANRIDDRESNNLISDIKLSKGKIEFDPYTSNYEVTISKNTKEVDVGATLDSAGSKFVSGYTPGRVTINEDETSKVIKVISEAGIVRSYVITFVRSGAKLDTSINSSVYLSSLSVPGTGLEFDKETNSYTVSVGYEVQELPVNAYAESKNAKVDIIGNYNFKVGTNAIEVLVTNGSKARVYTIYVIRKQDGLTIDEDTALSTLTVKGYNIGFKPDIFDYAVKIKREKSLIITATPLSNRSEVYMYGNNDLTGFSTVRVKVIAENGNTSLYSIDIQKDAFNEKLEKILTISAVGVAIIGGVVIFIKNRKRKMKEYLGE